MLDGLSIRLADISDTNRIVEIYNEAIVNRKNALLDEILLSDYQISFRNRDLKNFPILVATINNSVVGWISLSPYRANRKAYQNLKEVSFYIDNHFTGKGIGSLLLKYIINERSKFNYKSLIAILVANNQESVYLLKKFGFSLWGCLPNVLDMDDASNDALIYGKNFE